MTIFTPRGLKIRLDIQTAFAYMERLYPEVKPFKFLKTVEGINVIPGMLCFLVGLSLMLLKYNPIDIAIWSFAAQLLGFILVYWPIIPSLLPIIVTLGTLYSYIIGWGILVALLIVIGFIFVGWQGVLAYFVGKYAAVIIQYGFEFAIFALASRRYTDRTSLPSAFSSERHFMFGYLMYAHKFKKEIEITADDVESGKWKEVLNEFASDWPQVVSRFE
jgi:hypothetical protein